MDSSKINYLEIIKNAWDFTWKYKRLWWLGFFLSIGESGVSIFQYSSKAQKEINLPNNEIKEFLAFIGNNTAFLTATIIIFFVISLLLLLLKILAKGALVKSIHASSTRALSIKESFQESKKYFWKVLSIEFFVSTFVILTVLLLLLPVVFLFYHHQYAIGAILSFLAIIIVIPLIFLASFLEIYGLLYLLLGGLSIWSSIEQAYFLLRNNLRSSILMSLVMMLLNMVLFIIMALALLPVIVALAFMALFLIAIFQKVGIALSIAFGLAILIIPLVLLRSVYTVLIQSAWIFFFNEIAKPKEEQASRLVPEKEMEIKSIPKADAVGEM